MTPKQFRKIRERAGYSVDQLAAVLRISDGRSVRRWEDGSRKVSGPVSLIMSALEQGLLTGEDLLNL
jgi:DNA-binding transcriptional regulator YiaG